VTPQASYFEMMEEDKGELKDQSMKGHER